VNKVRKVYQVGVDSLMYHDARSTKHQILNVVTLRQNKLNLFVHKKEELPKNELLVEVMWCFTQTRWVAFC
jgi:hypothetical protein